MSSEETGCFAKIIEDIKILQIEQNIFEFGVAIEILKKGARIARLDWAKDGRWLSLSCSPEGLINGREIAAENFWSKHNSNFARENGGSAVVLPCITEKTANGEIQMGWTPSQQDMFAKWVIV